MATRLAPAPSRRPLPRPNTTLHAPSPAAAQVNSDLDLFREIDKYGPGERVSLAIARLRGVGGKAPTEEELRVPITLQAMEAT